MATATPPPPPRVSTQCEYESWNTTTNCWNYRKCAACLQTKGCMIGQSGMCKSIDTATAQHNYTRAFALDLVLPAAKDTMNRSMSLVTQEWEFPALQVTYCAKDDAICSQCISEKFWMNGIFDSRFCVGANGCVCVSGCEFAYLSPSCDPDDPSFSVPVQTTPPAQPTRPSLPTYSQCRYSYTDPVTGCYNRRSCQNCLDQEGCRIGTDGRCEPDAYAIDSSPLAFDYRRAIQSNLTLPGANDTALEAQQSWHFPASTLAYCSLDDTICAQTIQEDYWLSPGQPRDSRFCVGTDGCVSIANCLRYDNLTECPTPHTKVDDDDSADTWRRFDAFITALIVGLVLIVIGVTCACCRRKQKKDNSPVARLVDDHEVAALDDTAAPAYVVVHPA